MKDFLFIWIIKKQQYFKKENDNKTKVGRNRSILPTINELSADNAGGFRRLAFVKPANGKEEIIIRQVKPA